MSDNRALMKHLYTTSLGRNAGMVEQGYWTTLLDDGASRAQVAADIASSPETAGHLAMATADGWLPDPHATTVLETYQARLGRAAEPGGWRSGSASSTG